MVSWPRHVRPGESFLITIDLRLSDPTLQWPYEDEELWVGCMVDGRPVCTVRAPGDAGVILHRFGGTYGPAQFVAKVSDEYTNSTDAALWLTLTTAGGVPFYTGELPLGNSETSSDSPNRVAASAINSREADIDGSSELSLLALRLSSERRDAIKRGLTEHVPPNWNRQILIGSPAGEVGVFMQASALLSDFITVGKTRRTHLIASIRDRYSLELALLARRLIRISAAPPNPRNHDAQILLGILANYAFEPLKDLLEVELRTSPLGFRAWRNITEIIALSEIKDSPALKTWIRRLINDSEELRKDSLYAACGFDLELAISIPTSWSPPEDDWVGAALRARARNFEASIRERGTAAAGMWQRALAEDRPDLRQTEDYLRQLITEFRDPSSRPDAAAGLRWLAATLEHVIDSRVPVCSTWPDIDEPWFAHVQDAVAEFDNYEIPASLLGNVKNLFRHVILQNAGVYRYEAIELIVARGWNEPVAKALRFLLRTEQNETWLRVRALFALGLLQRRNVSVETDLVDACQHAYNNLRLEDQHPVRSHVSEMHAALFAVGDCFGVTGAEERARDARERLRPILTELATAEGDRAQILRRPARAAAYLLTVTAQPSSAARKDLSQDLLEQLSHHPDPVTARLSRWALSFRFAPDGTIRPFLAVAQQGDENYDTK